MQNKYRGTNIGSRKQKALLQASLNNPPETPLHKLAAEADVSMQSVSRWFANPDFEHWWIMSHYDGARGLYVEKIIRAVCERAIQPDAKARDRELALQILAPERLNKVAQPANRNAIVFNFIGTDKKLDMPKLDAKLPPEPRLVSYDGGPEDAEEVIEADADVA